MAVGIAFQLAMRRRVYPGWVSAGKLKQPTADHELLAMERIVLVLKCVKDTIVLVK